MNRKGYIASQSRVHIARWSVPTLWMGHCGRASHSPPESWSKERIESDCGPKNTSWDSPKVPKTSYEVPPPRRFAISQWGSQGRQSVIQGSLWKHLSKHGKVSSSVCRISFTYISTDFSIFKLR